MTDHSKPFGSQQSFAMVGPKNKTPASLAARMPSAEIAAKVGLVPALVIEPGRRVVRWNAQD